MASIEIIPAPFHDGVRGDSVGQGPLRLMALGLVDRLAAAGTEVTAHDLGEIGK